MKKTGIIFFPFFISIGFCLDLTSGGQLSKNQLAMDVTHYNLKLKVDPYRQTISGTVIITFKLFNKTEELEIDLKDGYTVSGTSVNGMNLAFDHKDNKIMIDNPGLELFTPHYLEIKYGGKPPVAKRPPWDGGFIWEKSKDGHHWIGVSCQANGAHIWYPCKEHPSDKPNGVDLSITVPEPLMVVANGLLQSVDSQGDKWTIWRWRTEYPISTYNVNFTVGYFETIEKTGYILDEPLPLVFYVLPEARDGAVALLNDAENYLNFYARNFGQYPWMDEKFGLVHTPYWGMEHQTINAYGNEYKKTSRGYDFLMFHEMGHEWWGNYLSVADWSDFWIHEGFDTYAEAMFIEENYGIESLRNFIDERYKKNIKNKSPVVPERNSTTRLTSGNDVYYKGAHILHMLRYLIGDKMLRESLKEFIHMPKELPHNQTSTKEFISLIHENIGTNIQWFFQQYLYSPELPTLNIETEVIRDKKFIDLWWENEGFKMPLEITFNSFDGKRERKLDLNNSPNRIAIPVNSELTLDPDRWLLYHQNTKN